MSETDVVVVASEPTEVVVDTEVEADVPDYPKKHYSNVTHCWKINYKSRDKERYAKIPLDDKDKIACIATYKESDAKYRDDIKAWKEKYPKAAAKRLAESAKKKKSTPSNGKGSKRHSTDDMDLIYNQNKKIIVCEIVKLDIVADQQRREFNKKLRSILTLFGDDVDIANLDEDTDFSKIEVADGPGAETDAEATDAEVSDNIEVE